MIDAEPALRVTLSGAAFDQALLALADFVDLKSPYTLGHARAVAELAAATAVQLGLAEDETSLLRRAGLVHDLGRLGVSNAIWDKPGPLGAGEWERVRLHPYLTERMLQQSSALAPLGGDRRPAPRAAGRLGLPEGPLGRGDHPAGADPRSRRRVPVDARAASPPAARSARSTRLRSSRPT